MSVLSDFNSVKLSVISLKSKKDATAESLKSHTLSLQEAEGELQDLQTRKRTLLSSIEVMKQLIEALSREQINALKDLISYGLKTIFVDRDYSLDIVISESRNVKQANFFLVETLADGSVLKSEFRDAIGGGVLAVVGLIIQVYYIIYFSQRPILFMDEALSQISTQYIGPVLEFINQLAEQKHFKFVLVSHDDRFIEYGRRVYSVNSGRVTLVRGGGSN